VAHKSVVDEAAVAEDGILMWMLIGGGLHLLAFFFLPHFVLMVGACILWAPRISLYTLFAFWLFVMTFSKVEFCIGECVDGLGGWWSNDEGTRNLGWRRIDLLC